MTDQERRDAAAAPAGPADRGAYARAGVDVAAGERAVELMRAAVERTHRPEVVGGIGGFAGLFDASALRAYRRPLLATSSDGVGTKVAVAAALDRHDTIGIDLVAMLVDDLVVCGAEPWFVTDYIACGHLVPERIATIVGGVAEGCRQAGAALLGGETAEHPGLLAADEYDVAGAATGVVEADRLLGAHRVVAGDVILALGASGLHANGYSLVRHVLAEQRWPLDRYVADLGRTWGEELLEPTRIYARDVLAVLDRAQVHAMAHVTGGGLAGNLARVMPAGLVARVDRGSWSLPPVVRLLAAAGGLAATDLETTLNLGVGMVLVTPPAAVDAALAVLTERAVPAWIAGRVDPAPQAGSPRAELVGSHPAD